jgi:hypothetical protein
VLSPIRGWLGIVTGLSSVGLIPVKQFQRFFAVVSGFGLFVSCVGSAARAEFRVFKSESSAIIERFPRDLLFAQGLKMSAIEKAVAQCRSDQQTSCEVKSSTLIFEKNTLLSRIKALAIVHGLSAPQLQEQQKFKGTKRFYQEAPLQEEELQGVKELALQSAMTECQQSYLICGFESVEITERNKAHKAEDGKSAYASEGQAVVIGYPPAESPFFHVEPEPEEIEP